MGFDRLTVWHRWNGHACIDLIVAHVVFTVWGYALIDKIPLPNEISTMLGGGIYPGMITATIGTAMLLAVVATSIVIVASPAALRVVVRRALLAYPASRSRGSTRSRPATSSCSTSSPPTTGARLYIVTIALLVVWRVLVPLAGALRYRLRVAEVTTEGPGVVSLRITGRNLDRLRARAGQFFLWRFLARERWGTAHPFSLSAAPDGARCASRSRGSATTRRGSVRSSPERGCSPKARSASSRRRRADARRPY